MCVMDGSKLARTGESARVFFQVLAPTFVVVVVAAVLMAHIKFQAC